MYSINHCTDNEKIYDSTVGSRGQVLSHGR